jgi:maltooligosyltrehalose trehalohydrolase
MSPRPEANLARPGSPDLPSPMRLPARPPGFGAVPEGAGVRFRVMATRGQIVRLDVLTGPAAGAYTPIAERDGIAEFFVPGAQPGQRYHYIVDGSPPRPDPASRFQPDGVHGPSEIVDPASFRWAHDEWQRPSARELVVYELHVGTFTPAGTFGAARGRLGDLRDLGITAIELMPVADFGGTRNWGYDGVCLYGPSRVYGRPDDLRALVDAAHGAGIAVFLDVVYNHLGPEGAYLTAFNPDYVTSRHSTPWGGAINLDGAGSALVRSFIIDNALHWIREYHLDGLRLDATHTLIDTSPTHVVAELVAMLRRHTPWPLTVHAEDSRNLAHLFEPLQRGGWDVDGIWADDFHHVVRRHLAGDSESYYSAYAGTTAELARTIRQGWLFTGQFSAHKKAPRGTDASHVPMQQFVVCLQNHDQIGNRATGDRLHHAIEPAAWRAASVVLLTAPMTPLLFMGQEWAASTPFLFFTDLEPWFGSLVTEGRRREFRGFKAFADRATWDRIPDPQATSTHAASILNWEERETGVHRLTLNLYRELLRLRKAHVALGAAADPAGDADAVEGGALVMRRQHGRDRFCVVARLSGTGPATASVAAFEGEPTVVLSTEDDRYADDSMPPQIEAGPGRLTVRFDRPGAVILRLS